MQLRQRFKYYHNTNTPTKTISTKTVKLYVQYILFKIQSTTLMQKLKTNSTLFTLEYCMYYPYVFIIAAAVTAAVPHRLSFTF